MNINSISYVVNEVLADLNIPQGTNFEQTLHFAIKGYRDLNIIGVMPSTKTIRLAVNPRTHSVKLPDDYVDYLRVSMVCRSACGYETLINLVYNDDIALHGEDTRLHCSPEDAQKVINGICDYHDNLHGRKLNPNWQPGQSQWSSPTNPNCNQWNGNGWNDNGHGGGCGCGCCDITSGESQNTVQGVWQNGESTCRPMPGAFTEQGCNNNSLGLWAGVDFVVWGWGVFYNGAYNYAGMNFGIGSGFYHGGFKINKELRTIQFDSCFNCHKIVMEYRSNGVSITGDSFIPVDCIPALNEYIHYQRNLHGQGSLQEKYFMSKMASEHKRNYYSLREEIVHRLNAMTDSDYLDIFRRLTFQQIKI